MINVPQIGLRIFTLSGDFPFGSRNLLKDLLRDPKREVIIIEQRKTRPYFPLHWLFDRDPYHGLL